MSSKKTLNLVSKKCAKFVPTLEQNRQNNQTHQDSQEWNLA